MLIDDMAQALRLTQKAWKTPEEWETITKALADYDALPIAKAGSYPAIPLTLLPDVIAQVVEFALDDYSGGGILPQEIEWNIGYIVSCMLAQHTPEGDSGVDMECGWAGMKVTESMPYADRLALAQKLVTEWSHP